MKRQSSWVPDLLEQPHWPLTLGGAGSGFSYLVKSLYWASIMYSQMQAVVNRSRPNNVHTIILYSAPGENTELVSCEPLVTTFCQAISA